MAIISANPSVNGTNIQWYIAVKANCALDQSINDKSIFSTIINNIYSYIHKLRSTNSVAT